MAQRNPGMPWPSGFEIVQADCRMTFLIVPIGASGASPAATSVGESGAEAGSSEGSIAAPGVDQQPATESKIGMVRVQLTERRLCMAVAGARCTPWEPL